MRTHGIGADGLIEKMDENNLSLPKMVEKHTDGLVKSDEIIHYDITFHKERHREQGSRERGHYRRQT